MRLGGPGVEVWRGTLGFFVSTSVTFVLLVISRCLDLVQRIVVANWLGYVIFRVSPFKAFFLVSAS